jgi:hypothetical protein
MPPFSVKLSLYDKLSGVNYNLGEVPLTNSFYCLKMQAWLQKVENKKHIEEKYCS